MLTMVQKQKLKDFYVDNSGGAFLVLVATISLMMYLTWDKW